MWNLVVAAFLPLFLFAALWPRRRRLLLIWGSAPIKTNRYWSHAMREAGHDSLTVVTHVYSINSRTDFDKLFEEFTPKWLPRSARFGLGACIAFLFVLRKASILYTSYWGFALGMSVFWPLEGLLLCLAGVKVVVMPFGGDAYLYSQVVDTSLRYGLLASYPNLSRTEAATQAKVTYWNRRADVVIAGLMIDGLGRWDVTANQYFVVDTEEWRCKMHYSDHDGSNGPVVILHTPNHRGFKGTEFVEAAVAQLVADGLQVELVLLEGVPNEQVRTVMASVDILAEQFIATGYALNGIEGLASGLPVMANLEHEAYTRVFRRYGFLNECPILSTSPETLVRNLRVLVENPQLRRTLGQAGRAFAEKYHSYAMAQYLFGSIQDKLLYGKDIDLINLFHPLKSEYNRRTPIIAHPLVDNRLPLNWDGE